MAFQQDNAWHESSLADISPSPTIIQTGKGTGDVID
jgi:hypothetical protein